jgi:hypothetical protein
MLRPGTYIILLGMLLVFGSCSSDEDSTDPVITFFVPAENYHINMPDTIDVEAEISDDRMISSVSVTLVDDHKITVVAPKYYYPNSPQFYIRASFELVDKSLASGPYHILVSATDGVNPKDKYRAVYINEIPVKIEGYIAVTGQFDFKSTIARLNPAFETDTQFIFPESYFLSGIHGLWEKFFFISGGPAELKAFNTTGFEVEWEIAADPPRQAVTAVVTDKELIFSTANGDVAITDNNGDITLRTAPYTSKTITCLAADEDYIFAAHVSLSGTIHELTVYYRVTGFVRDQEVLAGEISGLVAVNGVVLVFMPSVSGTAVMEYDPENQTLAQLTILPVENINETVKISDNEIFLLTDNLVVSYHPSNGSYAEFADQPYKVCRFDHLNDIVFLVKDLSVYGFDRVSGDLMAEKTFPEEVLDFHILYNK